MGRIVLSEEAALKAITYSNEAREELIQNVNIMNNNVNARFEGLQDPAYKQYYELSMQMQDLLTQIGGKMDEVSAYCEKMVRFIREYKET